MQVEATSTLWRVRLTIRIAKTASIGTRGKYRVESFCAQRRLRIDSQEVSFK
jgi:hypothetical protein